MGQGEAVEAPIVDEGDGQSVEGIEDGRDAVGSQGEAEEETDEDGQQVEVGDLGISSPDDEHGKAEDQRGD